MEGNPKRRLDCEIEMLPTPTVNGNYNRNGLSETSGDGLATAIMALQTEEIGMKLQPRFVEWMMGYPDNYTELTD